MYFLPFRLCMCRYKSILLVYSWNNVGTFSFIAIVYWKLDFDPASTKIVNFVTALSPSPTYLELGSRLSTKPEVFNLGLVSITILHQQENPML